MITRLLRHANAEPQSYQPCEIQIDEPWPQQDDFSVEPWPQQDDFSVGSMDLTTASFPPSLDASWLDMGLLDAQLQGSVRLGPPSSPSDVPEGMCLSQGP